MVGKIKWFNDSRGYGFIENGTNEDIFVHFSAIRKNGYKSLIKDEEVQFEIVKTDKGIRAKNVVPIIK